MQKYLPKDKNEWPFPFGHFLKNIYDYNFIDSSLLHKFVTLKKNIKY